MEKLMNKALETSTPGGAHMHWGTALSLVQVLISSLSNTNLLPKPMLTLGNKTQWN